MVVHDCLDCVLAPQLDKFSADRMDVTRSLKAERVIFRSRLGPAHKDITLPCRAITIK